MTGGPPRGRRRWVTPLDRYVAGEFARIFGVTVLGFPVLVFVFDLVDNLRKYTAQFVSETECDWKGAYVPPAREGGLLDNQVTVLLVWRHGLGRQRY